MKRADLANTAHGYMGIWCGMAAEVYGEHMQFSADSLCAYATGVRILSVSQSIFSAGFDRIYRSRVDAARELARAQTWPTFSDSRIEQIAEPA